MFDVFVPPTWRRYVAPPVITSTATASIPENTTTVKTVTATGEGTISYSISGGIDAAKFSIGSSSGILSFISGPDYEAPGDVGGDNIYQVAVKALSSYGGFATQAISVTVTNVAEPPQFTSPVTVSITENTTAVMTVTATGEGTMTYSITGGVDSAKFSIGSANGALRFVTAPDYEAPGDVGGDNVYNVTVGVSSVGGSNTRAMAVTVTNVGDTIVLSWLAQNVYQGTYGGTVTVPASAQAGDLCVIFHGAQNSSGPAPSPTTPSGFTNLIVSSGALFLRGMISARILTAGQGGATFSSMNGTASERAAVLVFRPDRTMSSFAALSVHEEGTTGNPATQTITASGASIPVLALALWYSDGPVDTRLATPAMTEVYVGVSGFYGAYKIYNTNPVNHNIDVADSGSDNVMASCYITLS